MKGYCKTRYNGENTMAYENITKINIIGAPEINIPSTMTVETVLAAMRYDLANYDQRVEGTTLILSAAAGSKGALDVRLVDGKVLPRGGKTFPTDGDIDFIAQLFPKDNLFKTLEDPKKLQEYATALEEHAEDVVKAMVAAKQEKETKEVRESVGSLIASTKAISAYAVKVDNPAQARIATAIKAAADELTRLLELAEAYEIDAVKAQATADENARVLEEIRRANPGIEI